jgi:hypothetical protein
MSDKPSSAALRPQFRYRLRFNPQVLVLVVALGLAWPAIVGVVVSGVHVIWSGSFRSVGYTMHEAHANGDAPYVTGTLQGTGERFLVTARRRGETYLVGATGDEVFAPGKVVKLWWSPTAPDIVIAGSRTNGIPVAAMAERPGPWALAGYVVWVLAVFWAGLRVAAWSMRFARA